MSRSDRGVLIPLRYFVFLLLSFVFSSVSKLHNIFTNDLNKAIAMIMPYYILKPEKPP